MLVFRQSRGIELDPLSGLLLGLLTLPIPLARLVVCLLDLSYNPVACCLPAQASTTPDFLLIEYM